MQVGVITLKLHASVSVISVLVSDAKKLVSAPGLPAIFLLHLTLALLLASSLALVCSAHASAGELLISTGPCSGPLVPLCCTKRKHHCPGFWKTALMEAPSVPNSPTSPSSSSLLPGSSYFTPSFLAIPPFLLIGHPPYRMTWPCLGASQDASSGITKASLFCLCVSSGRGGLWSQHQQLWLQNGKVSSVP